MTQTIQPRENPDLSSASTWKVKLLYDGECPLCLREVNFLKQKDRGRNLVIFVNIASPNYNPEEHGGIDYQTAMANIHAVLPDQKIIKNIEVFRYVYEVLGMGWIYAITKIPIFRFLANFIYQIWAKLRFKITGRPDLDTLVKLYQKKTKCDQNCNLDSTETARNLDS